MSKWWKEVKIPNETPEQRERALREAIEEAINEKSQWGDAENALDVVTRHLSKTLASLYSEEGEANDRLLSNW